MPKRFVLFSYEAHEESGRMGTYMGAYLTLADAQAAYDGSEYGDIAEIRPEGLVLVMRRAVARIDGKAVWQWQTVAEGQYA